MQCKHCKKPMLQAVAYAHIKVCLQKKNEKAQKKKEQKEANRKAREAREKAEKAEEEAAVGEDDDESVNGEKSASVAGAKNGAAGAGAGGNASKKRKADGEGDKAPTKKKTKKELEAAAKPKGAKPKGPVDVERQCGVLLPNGQMCARSLTCKSHAMGAKRAVPGRSQRYDLLLAAYQKKNQAKQQSTSPTSRSLITSDAADLEFTEAAIDANAPLLDDAAENAGPVDSDEEKELVMAAIARARPRALDQHVFVPMRRRCNYLRVKEMLSNALGTARSGGGGVFGSGGSAAVAPSTTSAGGEGEGRRMSFAQPGNARGAGPSTAAGPVRKPSGSTVPTGASTAIAT